MSTSRATHTARLIEWDRKKGFGYLRHGKRRLFLHWRDFSGKHRRPQVGDEIRFEIGKDAKGRPCAQNAVQLHQAARLGLATLAILLALLILPGLAIYLNVVHFQWPALYIFAISAFTYWRYAVDKKLAKTPDFRVPEAQLQTLDILGGWPGGFLAQRRLRHKCSKPSYHIPFWLIVAVHQCVAIYVILGGAMPGAGS